MLNPALVLETALLVLAAFLVGATIGTLARLAYVRLAKAPTVASVSAPLEAPPAAEPQPALVTAPVIAPLNPPAAPATPAEVPVPDFAEIAKGLTAPVVMPEVSFPPLTLVPSVEVAAGPSMAPARVAGETTSGRLVPSPREPRITSAQLDEPPAETAEVIQFPVELATGPDRPLGPEDAEAGAAAAPPIEQDSADATQADVPDAASGLPDIAAESLEPESALAVEVVPASAAAQPPEGDPAGGPSEATIQASEAAVGEPEPVAAAIEIADDPAPELATEMLAAPASEPEPAAMLGETAAIEPVEPARVAPAPAEAATVPDAPASVNASAANEDHAAPAVVPEARSGPSRRPARAANADEDEAAAMRAIEGNWSPKRTKPRARATTAARASEPAAHAASAIATAPVAVEEPPPGKPEGLKAPRHGHKDNLSNIIGVLPIIETALNSLGVFHFDQVADLTDENATWIETHLGIPGRIAREHWREQARELALVSDRSRKVATKS